MNVKISLDINNIDTVSCSLIAKIFLLFQRHALSTYIMSLILLSSCVGLLISASCIIWSQLTNFPSTSFVETCPVLALFVTPCVGIFSVVFVFWTSGLFSLFQLHSSSISSTSCLFHHAPLTRATSHIFISSC